MNRFGIASKIFYLPVFQGFSGVVVPPELMEIVSDYFGYLD
jgi:hypothetical protein